MGGAIYAWERFEMRTRFLSGWLNRRGHSEDLAIDGKIILQGILCSGCVENCGLDASL